MAYVIYALAALGEIAGCFSFWAWLRLGKPVWWLLPGMLSLAAFAYLLTRIPADAAGRAYAAYGGVYIVGSVLWLWLAEGHMPCWQRHHSPAFAGLKPGELQRMKLHGPHISPIATSRSRLDSGKPELLQTVISFR